MDRDKLSKAQNKLKEAQGFLDKSLTASAKSLLKEVTADISSFLILAKEFNPIAEAKNTSTTMIETNVAKSDLFGGSGNLYDDRIDIFAPLEYKPKQGEGSFF